MTRHIMTVTEIEEAVTMAINRLEAALMGPEVCRGCVEVALHYLQKVKPEDDQS